MPRNKVISNPNENYACRLKGCHWKKRNGRCPRHELAFNKHGKCNQFRAIFKPPHLKYVHEDGQRERLEKLERVLCLQCGSCQLDIWQVIGDALEETQAYQCRECGHVSTFGVSE